MDILADWWAVTMERVDYQEISIRPDDKDDHRAIRICIGYKGLEIKLYNDVISDSVDVFSFDDLFRFEADFQKLRGAR